MTGTLYYTLIESIKLKQYGWNLKIELLLSMKVFTVCPINSEVLSELPKNINFVSSSS